MRTPGGWESKAVSTRRGVRQQGDTLSLFAWDHLVLKLKISHLGNSLVPGKLDRWSPCQVGTFIWQQGGKGALRPKQASSPVEMDISVKAMLGSFFWVSAVQSNLHRNEA